MLCTLSVLEVFGYYGFGTLAPIILLDKGFDPRHVAGFRRGHLHRLPTRIPVLAIPIVERIPSASGW